MFRQMNMAPLLTTVLLLPWLLTQAWAEPPAAAVVSTEHATLTLVSEEPQAWPGQTLWLGLHFELIPHWHVYWRNPGASGAAPSIRWLLPDGWHAGDIRWPVPKRIRVGALTNYGYEDKVTFLVPVRVPEGPLPKGPLTITADADWLVCREECIPETGSFSIRINDPDGDSRRAAETRALFAASRAQWPEPTTLRGRYHLDDDTLAIAVTPAGPMLDKAADVWFAADEWGPVDASGTQRWKRHASGLTLSVPVGDVPPTGKDVLDGLLVVEAADQGAATRRGYRLRLEAELTAFKSGRAGLLMALAFAVLGGLILNVMPCVLPVLGIKALGFIREAQAARRRLAIYGLVYSGGILFSFALLAAVLLALRSGGESLGWGFQLQSPILVTLLAYLMLLVGLNLSGVFSIGGGLVGVGQSLTARGGLFSTFATGVLAAVVASPCIAPFMGAALGFALTRPPWEALAVFLALGAGFSLPILLLSLFPVWLRFIPKPGPWMRRFQQTLAFPMFATAAWLLWVLSQQTDPRTYGSALAGLVLVAMAAWLYGQWKPRGWRLGLLGAGLTGIVILAIAPMATPESTANARTGHRDAPWSEQQVRQLTAAGRPVFVNFTAAWCITCKVNEQVALSTASTRRLFESRSVAYLVADWTRRDPVITRQLERHGHSGVPLYLLYSPTAEQPVVLPQLLTEAIVAEAIDKL